MTHESQKPGDVELVVRDKRSIAASVVELTLVSAGLAFRSIPGSPESTSACV